MAQIEPAQDISLNHGESFAGPVLQIFLDLRAIEPLKQQPGGVAQVEEGAAMLVDKIPPIRADLESQAFDGTRGCNGNQHSLIPQWVMKFGPENMIIILSSLTASRIY